MYWITETLLVGNIEDARQPMAAIAALLLVAEEFSIEPPPWLEYQKVPFKEFAPVDAVSLDRAVSWVESRDQGSRVLVCCRAGMGRSASVVIAYFCCVRDMSYDDAVALVKAKRPGAVPLPNLQETIAQVRQLRRQRQDHAKHSPPAA